MKAKTVRFSITLDIHFVDDFDKFDKMKDEFDETEDKYDFDLGIEIPDEEDFQMQTPVRKNRLSDNDST